MPKFDASAIEPTPTPKPAAPFRAPQATVQTHEPSRSAQFAGTFAYLVRSRYIIPAAGPKKDGLRLAFDTETNGLVDAATMVHCIVIADLDSDRIDAYGPEQIPAALEHLARATYLAGHNITGFDLPLLQRLFGWAPTAGCDVVDTLVSSRLILPHLEDLDDQAAAMSKFKLGKQRGRHSLEAWGLRLNMPKVGADIESWEAWTPEIQERCIGDAKLTVKLWHFLQPDGQSHEALELEHRAAAICNRITADGVPFDVAAAKQLYERWEARRCELGAQLRQQLPEIKNLNSRRQLGTLLESRSWKPTKRTPKTQQPVIDDELLESLPTLYPEFAGLAEHDLLRRRLAQLAGGSKAWLSHIDTDGRIHGGLVHIGTPHSRAKHLEPNVAQVPNHKKGVPFAAECRALFRHPGDWLFVTCDQANLQDRGFAHYLADYDGGAYAQTFIDGLDQHWLTAAALELVPVGVERDRASKLHAAIREGSKTFRYAFLYGGGAAKLGHVIGDIVRTVQHIDAGNDLRKRIFNDIEHPSEAELKRIGKTVL